MAKGFKSNVTETFITGEEQVGFDVPEGYVLIREPKSARLQLLVRPATKELLQKGAARYGISLNEMCNRVLDTWAKKEMEGR